MKKLSTHQRIYNRSFKMSSFLKSSSSYSEGCSHHNNSLTNNNSKNKSTSMLSLFSTKSFSAKKTAKKIQSQSANSYGSYSNLFSAASYGSMCSLDKAGKKQKKRYWFVKVYQNWYEYYMSWYEKLENAPWCDLINSFWWWCSM